MGNVHIRTALQAASRTLEKPISEVTPREVRAQLSLRGISDTDIESVRAEMLKDATLASEKGRKGLERLGGKTVAFASGEDSRKAAANVRKAVKEIEARKGVETHSEEWRLDVAARRHGGSAGFAPKAATPFPAPTAADAASSRTAPAATTEHASLEALRADVATEVRISDLKGRVGEKSAKEKKALKDNFEKKFYTPYSGHVRFKFDQGSYMPKNYGGVCAAMTMHWAHRSMVKGKESFAVSKKDIVADDGATITTRDGTGAGMGRYTLAADMGQDSKRMLKKFEKLVEKQEHAGNSHAKAAEAEGLTLVGHRDGDVAPERVLFNGRVLRSEVDALRTACDVPMSMAKDALLDLKMAKEEEGVCSARLADAQRALDGVKPARAPAPPSDLRQEVDGARSDLAAASSRREDCATEYATQLGAAKAAVATLNAKKDEVATTWANRIDAALEPNKTYSVIFGGKQGHTTAVRTGPAVEHPAPGQPRFAHLDVMDPNIGEFHFGTAPAAENASRVEFLKTWGKTYFVDESDFNRAEFYEIKPR